MKAKKDYQLFNKMKIYLPLSELGDIDTCRYIKTAERYGGISENVLALSERLSRDNEGIHDNIMLQRYNCHTCTKK